MELTVGSRCSQGNTGPGKMLGPAGEEGAKPYNSLLAKRIPLPCQPRREPTRFSGLWQFVPEPSSGREGNGRTATAQRPWLKTELPVLESHTTGRGLSHAEVSQCGKEKQAPKEGDHLRRGTGIEGERWSMRHERREWQQ